MRTSLMYIKFHPPQIRLGMLPPPRSLSIRMAKNIIKNTYVNAERAKASSVHTININIELSGKYLREICALQFSYHFRNPSDYQNKYIKKGREFACHQLPPSLRSECKYLDIN